MVRVRLILVAALAALLSFSSPAPAANYVPPTEVICDGVSSGATTHMTSAAQGYFFATTCSGGFPDMTANTPTCGTTSAYVWAGLKVQ